MNKIERLIQRLSPEGVPTYRLEQLGELFSGLAGKSKEDFAGGISKYVSYLDIANNAALPQDIKSQVFVAQGERQNEICRGDLLFTGSSEDRAGVGLTSEVEHEPDEPTYLNSFCFGWRPYEYTFATGFLKHLFRSQAIRKQVIACSNGVTRINISKKQLQDIYVPVPPLQVQEEIVLILDKFTALGAELEAELEARSLQGFFYRKKLLSFGSEMERSSLDDVSEYVNGKAHERLVSSRGTIPLVTARFISRNGEANRHVEPENVLTPANIGDVALVLSDLPNGRALARSFFVDADNSYAINQRVARLRVRNLSRLDPKFMFYILDRNPDLVKYDNGADQTHLSKSQVTGLKFPLPEIKEQREIVRVLDSFNSLLNNMSSGLPAEIQARRKQYEYYRNKLLTFKELDAA